MWTIIMSKLAKNSLIALLRTVPRWLWILLFCLAAVIGFIRLYESNMKKAVDKAVTVERLRVEALYEKQVQASIVQAEASTAENTKSTAQLDVNYFKEYQNAVSNVNYWRNRALSERVPNETTCAKNLPVTSSTSNVGDGATTATIDNRQIDVPSASIIELSTIASKMRAQVEYLQDKVNIDAATVNNQ